MSKKKKITLFAKCDGAFSSYISVLIGGECSSYSSILRRLGNSHASAVKLLLIGVLELDGNELYTGYSQWQLTIAAISQED